MNWNVESIIILCDKNKNRVEISLDSFSKDELLNLSLQRDEKYMQSIGYIKQQKNF